MEDVIYILIGVAWVVYTVYNQNQKQKRKQATQMGANASKDLTKPEEKVKSVFEERFNLDKMFGFDDPVAEYLDSPYSKIDVVEEKDETSYFKAETEGVSAFKDETETDEGIVDEIKISYSEEKMNDLTLGPEANIDEFDARKAVIYSEILNPPYIKN